MLTLTFLCEKPFFSEKQDNIICVMLRMEIAPSDEQPSQDNVFIYNDHLAEDAQAVWIAQWLRQKQMEFESNSKLIAQNPDYIKRLADLFKESYEVNNSKTCPKKQVFGNEIEFLSRKIK